MSSAPLHVFGYGSLLEPFSLLRTVPGVNTEHCLPAECQGFRRDFGVAFPNDGSEPDKAYFTNDGIRPPRILFCDIQLSRNSQTVNGILVPVNSAELDALTARELRYSQIDVTSRIAGVQHGEQEHLEAVSRVVAFVGKSKYRVSDTSAYGVVPHEYLSTITRGAMHWDHLYPGFWDSFCASTDMPDPDQVAPLRRQDYV